MQSKFARTLNPEMLNQKQKFVCTIYLIHAALSEADKISSFQPKRQVNSIFKH